MTGDDQIRWHKTSRCESSACVEVARAGGWVLLRDSAEPGGPVLSVSLRQWGMFVNWLKDGPGR